MFFKNLSLYGFSSIVSESTLSSAIDSLPFEDIKPAVIESAGFVNPITKDKSHQPLDLLHSINGYSMFCIRIDTKIIPSSAVKKLVDDRVSAKELEGGSKLSKKERAEIKDDIVLSILPTALIGTKFVFGYFDFIKKIIVIDSGSSAKAEKTLSCLRKALGSLSATPISFNKNLSEEMAKWVTDKFPENACQKGAVVIKTADDGEGSGEVRFKNTNLLNPDVANHIENGGLVSQISIGVADQYSFSLGSDFLIKKFKTDCSTPSDNDGESETAAERFDADFSILTSSVSDVIDYAVAWFGGIKTGDDKIKFGLETVVKDSF